jgi:hypothetical protein
MENKLTPLKRVRKYCLSCMDGSSKEIDLCPSNECALYKFRKNKGGVKLIDIKTKCLDCAGTYKEVKTCEFDGIRDNACPLFPYRLGKRPKGTRLPDTKQVIASKSCCV